MPFSAPTNIGRWPKLLPITTSSLGNCPEAAFIASLPDLACGIALSAASLKAEGRGIAIASLVGWAKAHRTERDYRHRPSCAFAHPTTLVSWSEFQLLVRVSE